MESPVSLWDISAGEADYRSAPDRDIGPGGDIDTDVAIVGGGFTGLSTALHCAGKGLGVHVLEARHIGFGGSGRNVGLVNAGVWHPPAAVRRSLGDIYGPRFVQRFGNGPAQVFDLIDKYHIRCEAVRTGTIHAAHAPSGLRDLEARHAEWARLGAPVELLSREEMARKTGSEAFHGGLLDHRAGTINPMGYCRGLARAARGAGAAITTGVRATALSRDGGRDGGAWIVETAPDQTRNPGSDRGQCVGRGVGQGGGRIRAKHVVLATNAYTGSLWPGLKNTFTTINYFQLATEPLTADISRILPGRQGLWDTGRIMFSLRRDAFDRLLIGSMGTVLGGTVPGGTVMGSSGRGLSQRWAGKQLARLYPDLGPVTFTQAWSGQIAMTPDHLPRIYRLAPGLYTPIGYNGRGITTGTIFGECMADLLTGTDPATLPLPVTEPAPVAFAPFMSRLYQVAFTANQILKAV